MKPLSKLKGKSSKATAATFDSRTNLLVDIRSMRVDKGLTLRSAAEASGVSHTTLWRIELGREPDLWTALMLARFYEIDVQKIWMLK